MIVVMLCSPAVGQSTVGFYQWASQGPGASDAQCWPQQANIHPGGAQPQVAKGE